jgi:hypothetical protein
MKYIRSIFIICSLLLSLFSYSQQQAKRIDSIQKLKLILQTDNVVSTQNVGYAALPSKYWYAFAYLLLMSDNEELLAMTHDSTAAIRFYAYIGLIHNKYSDISMVKTRLMQDSAGFVTFIGCVISGTTIESGTKSIEDWYNEKSTLEVLTRLGKDKKYRMRLFRDLVNPKGSVLYGVE